MRMRAAVRKGAAVSVIHDVANDWAMPIATSVIAPAANWVQALADVATAIGADKGAAAPAKGNATDAAKAIAQSLLGGERKAILLGNAAAHHANASSLLALANWIGAQTGATVGYLTEAANTVGAQLVGALPGQWPERRPDAGRLAQGRHPAQHRAGVRLAAAQRRGARPRRVAQGGDPVEHRAGVRFGGGPEGSRALAQAEMVVTLSPFKANLEFSDVLLPIAPFTETPGTFVNAEGRVQSFHAVVKPAGETRPAWKVLRVLANLLGLPGFDFESAQEVLAAARGAQDAQASHVQGGKLGNATSRRPSTLRPRRASRSRRRSTSSTASCAGRRRCN